MEETFFNKDFWRQLVAVLVGASLGAFLGFGGALLTGAYFALRRRWTLARITRQVIVRETIENLMALSYMDKLTRAMREEGFAPRRFSSLRPSAEVLRQFMTAESMAALCEGETRVLLFVIPQLAYLRERYDKYEQVLQRPKDAFAPVNVEGEGTVAYRDAVTDRLLADMAGIASNLLEILVRSCYQARRTLVDDESKEVASKLVGLTFGPTGNFGRVFKSSLLKGDKQLDLKKCLVVWEHDWPECPAPVIELCPQRD